MMSERLPIHCHYRVLFFDKFPSPDRPPKTNQCSQPAKGYPPAQGVFTGKCKKPSPLPHINKRQKLPPIQQSCPINQNPLKTKLFQHLPNTLAVPKFRRKEPPRLIRTAEERGIDARVDLDLTDN